MEQQVEVNLWMTLNGQAKEFEICPIVQNQAYLKGRKNWTLSWDFPPNLAPPHYSETP